MDCDDSATKHRRSPEGKRRESKPVHACLSLSHAARNARLICWRAASSSAARQCPRIYEPPQKRVEILCCAVDCHSVWPCRVRHWRSDFVAVRCSLIFASPVSRGHMPGFKLFPGLVMHFWELGTERHAPHARHPFLGRTGRDYRERKRPTVCKSFS